MQRRIIILTAVLVILASGFSSPGRAESEQSKRNIVDVILNDRSSFFYLDTSDYPSDNSKLPIGIFDSGTGGLTVLNAIVNFDKHDNNTHRYVKKGDGLRDFRREYFIYLGDKANMPYGNYPSVDKTGLLQEHIIKNVQFLLGNKYYLSGSDRQYRTDKPSVKAIVIACNTATAYGKNRVEQFLDKAGLDIKVIGIIDAGARAALQCLKTDQDACIAVLATAGTVSSNGYVNSLRSHIIEMGYSGDIFIVQQAGLGLAGAIDGVSEYIQPDATEPTEGYNGPSQTNHDAIIDMSIWSRYGFHTDKNELLFNTSAKGMENIQLNSIRNYIAYHLVTLMERIRATPGAAKLKVVILGCTHYPFYTDLFNAKLDELYNYSEDGKYIYRPFMTEHIELIDPAPSVANDLYKHLISTAKFNSRHLSDSMFFLSVPNLLNPHVTTVSPLEFTYEYKYGRRADSVEDYVKRVPFSSKCLSKDVYDRLSKKMPFLYQIIVTSGPHTMN